MFDRMAKQHRVTCHKCGVRVRARNIKQHCCKTVCAESTAEVAEQVAGRMSGLAESSCGTITTPELRQSVRKAVRRTQEFVFQNVDFKLLDGIVKKVTPNLCTVARHSVIFAMQTMANYARMSFAKAERMSRAGTIVARTETVTAPASSGSTCSEAVPVLPELTLPLLGDFQPVTVGRQQEAQPDEKRMTRPVMKSVVYPMGPDVPDTKWKCEGGESSKVELVKRREEEQGAAPAFQEVRVSDRYKRRKTTVYEPGDSGEHSHTKCESSDKSGSVSKPLYDRSRESKSGEHLSITGRGAALDSTTTKYDSPRGFTSASRTSMERGQIREPSEGGRARDTSAGDTRPRWRGDTRPYRSRQRGGWRLFRGRPCRGQFNPLPRYREPFRSQPEPMDNASLLRRLAFLEQKLGMLEGGYHSYR